MECGISSCLDRCIFPLALCFNHANSSLFPHHGQRKPLSIGILYDEPNDVMTKEISNFSVISSNSGFLICTTDSYRTNNTLEPLIAGQQR